jgi:hypothetical protein
MASGVPVVIVESRHLSQDNGKVRDYSVQNTLRDVPIRDPEHEQPAHPHLEVRRRDAEPLPGVRRPEVRVQHDAIVLSDEIKDRLVIVMPVAPYGS